MSTASASAASYKEERQESGADGTETSTTAYGFDADGDY